MKEFRLSIIVFLSIVCGVISCSTPLEKTIKQHERNGETIVYVGKKSLYVRNDNSLYVEDLTTQSKRILLDTQKDHYVKYFHPYFEVGQTKLVTTFWVNDYIDFARHLNAPSYQFFIWDGLGVYVKGEFDNGIYKFPDELFFLFTDLNMCIAVKDARCDTINGEPLVSFIATGDFWTYGVGANCVCPEWPQGCVNQEAFDYWKNNTWRMPTDTFEYISRLYMNSWGQIVTCDDFTFEKWGKTYNLRNMLDGDIFKDVDEIIVSEFHKHNE